MPLDRARLLQHLMDNIRDNIYFMDEEGRIILINQAGARWLGFDSPEEVVGKTDRDIFSDEHGEAAYADERNIMRTGRPMLGKEEKETWPDGHETWVSTSKMPLRDDAGRIVGIFGISRDITEHKKAELRAAAFAEENRRFRESMEEELFMAAQLQKTFFPSSYPVFPKAGTSDPAVVFAHENRSGGLVGGDFCSIRKVSDHEAGILLCDVMGHGVRSALGTAMVRAVVEDLSMQETDPGAFLERMNHLLMPIFRKGDLFLFATASYGVLDVRTGRYRFANAGHSIPVLMEKKASSALWLVEPDAARGPALGIADDPAYHTLERQLTGGSTLFMFTDGLVEIEDEKGLEYGEERLLEAASRHRALPLNELFPTLLDDARTYAGREHFSDDVCLAGFHLAE